MLTFRQLSEFLPQELRGKYWDNQDSSALLLGILNGTTISEDSLAVS